MARISWEGDRPALKDPKPEPQHFAASNTIYYVNSKIAKVSLTGTIERLPDNKCFFNSNTKHLVSKCNLFLTKQAENEKKHRLISLLTVPVSQVDSFAVPRQLGQAEKLAAFWWVCREEGRE